jgi:Zn-dependent protease/CBS domain-containing protein
LEPTVRIGRVAGVEIGFNWSLVIVVWLITWSLASGIFPEDFPGHTDVAYWLTALAASVVFFASLLTHELAHALVAKRQGARVEMITLWIFGGVAHIRGELLTPRAELRMAAAGPATSLALAVLFGGLAIALDVVGIEGLVPGAIFWLASINTILAIFNLVPAYPLDGGRILHALVWRRSGDLVRATTVAAGAGRVFAYLLIAFGFVSFAYEANLGGLWFMLIGWFLLSAARAEQSQMLLRTALKNVFVRDVMSVNPITTQADVTLDDFVADYIMSRRFSSFPVERAGEVIGLITLAQVRSIPAERRSLTRVQDVAAPLSEVAVADPDEHLFEVLERISGSREDRCLVMRDGRLVGIVSPVDVQRAIERASLKTPSASGPQSTT